MILMVLNTPVCSGMTVPIARVFHEQLIEVVTRLEPRYSIEISWLVSVQQQLHAAMDGSLSRSELH